MSTKHTPGPWSVEVSSNVEPGPYFPVRIAGPYADIARVNTNANARLIAAAPELLDAVLLIQDFVNDMPLNVRLALQRAIAKAKGDV